MIPLGGLAVQSGRDECLSSIILSPLDGNVKMSPHEPGDIHVDSEGIETSERYFTMRAREPGVSQSRCAALAVARFEAFDLPRRWIEQLRSSGSRQPRSTYPRRLPERTRERILQLVRTRYAGFNDHHLQEKLIEQEGFSLSRETLRRLLRSAGLASPRKRASARSSPAPSTLGARRRTGATGRLPA